MCSSSPAGNPQRHWLLALAALILANSQLLGVTDEELDRIRRKNVLSDTDIASVQEYVSLKMTQLLMATNVAQVDQNREGLLERRLSSATGSSWQIYRDEFVKAVKANFQKTLAQLKNSSDNDLTPQIRLSLAVIIAVMDHPDFIEESLPFLTDEDPLVRYWAAKSLSNAKIRQHILSLGASDPLVTRTASELKDCLNQETSSSVIAQVAQAAAISQFPDYMEILKNCLVKRWTAYDSWSVDQERNDLGLLKTALELVGQDDLVDQQDLERDLIYFSGKLYTAAYQRFAQSVQHVDAEGQSLVLLNDNAMQSLHSLLIEGEQAFREACIRRRPGTYNRSRMLSVIESRKWNGLQNAYDLLLGTDGSVNDVFSVYNAQRRFPYPVLSEPPQAVVESAAIRRQVSENLLKPET